MPSGAQVTPVTRWHSILANRMFRGVAFVWGCAGFALRHHLLGPQASAAGLQRLYGRAAAWSLRYGGAQVGARTVIEGPLFVNVDVGLGFSTLAIGEECYLGESVHLDIKGVVEIGDRNTISMGCYLLSHQDVGRSRLAARMPEVRPGVRLGSDCYIGAGAILLPGVTLGDACVVGAGAVVTGDVPPNHRAVGVPAKAHPR